jgi:hypothetical protein
MDEFVKRLPRKPMKVCPTPFVFEGSLADLYDFAEPNLPRPEAVHHFHLLLRDYMLEEDEPFIVRYVTGTERGETYETDSGDRFIPADNSPAWWMHFLTFNEVMLTREEFRLLAPRIPTHVHQISKILPDNVSQAGWYVAHIRPAKNGDTDYRAWDRKELIWRFLRNLHPCNFFLVPKLKEARLGEDQRIIDYFAARFQRRYAAVWSEFLSLTDIPADMENLGSLPISIGAKRTASFDVETPKTLLTSAASPVQPSVTYHASRLTFKFQSIEPLERTEAFRVVTKNGTYQMTKADFYRVFPNVVQSRSYQEHGIYNYVTTPRKAEEFLIDSDSDSE